MWLCRPLLHLAGLAAFAVALTAPVAAVAITGQGQGIISRWAASDRCVAAAQKQFPDYTAESLAKRDQALQQCLGGQLLPPRSPQAPQSSHP
jgi:hypothetical protein